MNNFIVSPQKDRQMKVWLIAAIVTTVLTYARPFVFAIDSGNVIMIALRRLFDSEWFASIIHIAYWVLFVWIIGQLVMSIPSSKKWTKGTLWVVLTAYVIRILFGYIIPQPEFGSPSLPTYHLVLSAITMVYTAALLILSYLLIRYHGGRLRQLGIAIGVWQLAPFLFSLLYMVIDTMPSSCWLAFHFIQMALTIYVFVSIRRVYVPMWS